MYLALKEMKKEKLRFIMIIAVTALIAFMVYFLASLAYGLAELNRTSVDYWDANGIVVSNDSNNNIYASSIDMSQLDKLGLNSKDAINISSMSIQKDDANLSKESTTNLVFMGYDLTSTHFKVPLIEGRNIEDDHEVVLSSNIRDSFDLKIDDTIIIPKIGRSFKVVGFSKNSNYNTVPVGYITQKMASQAMMIYTTGNPDVDLMATPTPNMPNRVSAVLIYDNVNEFSFNDTKLKYVPINQFINSIPGYQAQVATFGFMIIALTLISSLIIGIFMYILTMQKKSIFAVLKIQGFKNRYIMKSVIYQSLIVIIIGLLIGLVLTLITVYFIPAKVPVAIFWPLNFAASILTLLCSFIGTLFSARSILKIDPLDAL